MDGTVRPEVTNAIDEIQNVISSFANFTTNFDDQHYDMYREAIMLFGQGLDKLANVGPVNPNSTIVYTKAERDLIKPFISIQCKEACESLRVYLDGRRLFLKVDYDIAKASQPVQDIQNVEQSMNNVVNNLTPQEQPTMDPYAGQQAAPTDIQPAQQAEITDISQSNTESQSMGGQDLGRQRTLSNLPNSHKPSPFSIAA